MAALMRCDRCGKTWAPVDTASPHPLHNNDQERVTASLQIPEDRRPGSWQAQGENRDRCDLVKDLCRSCGLALKAWLTAPEAQDA